MKTNIRSSVAGLVLAGLAMTGGAAQAATTIYTAADSDIGSVLPSGAYKSPGYSVSSGTTVTFDLSGLQIDSVVSFVFDIFYKRTKDSATESWQAQIAGAAPVSLADTDKTIGETVFTLALGDAAFAAAIASKTFSVTFTDTNPANPVTGKDKFFLKTEPVSAGASGVRVASVTPTDSGDTQYSTLDVSTVPLPAGGLLLLTGLGGIGGLAALRRRKA